MSIENIIIPKFDMKDPEVGTKLNSFLYDLVQEIKEERKLKITAGRFTCPAGVGDYTVTGLGAKPRYVMLWGNYFSNVGVYLSWGQFDHAGNQNVVYMASKDDLQRNNGASNKCIRLLTVGGIDLVVATYKSMNDDGWTINFTVTSVSAGISWVAMA